MPVGIALGATACGFDLIAQRLSLFVSSGNLFYILMLANLRPALRAQDRTRKSTWPLLCIRVVDVLA